MLHGIDLEAATIPDLQRAMDRGPDLLGRADQLLPAPDPRARPKVNAVLAVNPDALKIAAASDQRARRHGARCPLEGIPILLKDNVGTDDEQPTTAGSFALLAAAEPATRPSPRSCARPAP